MAQKVICLCRHPDTNGWVLPGELAADSYSHPVFAVLTDSNGPFEFPAIQGGLAVTGELEDLEDFFAAKLAGVGEFVFGKGERLRYAGAVPSLCGRTLIELVPDYAALEAACQNQGTFFVGYSPEL